MRLLRRIFLTGTLIALIYTAIQLWDIYRVGHLDRDRTADCAIVLGAAAWHDKPSDGFLEAFVFCRYHIALVFHKI